MKMSGRKTQWAFKDGEIQRLLKKRELRAEEKQWRAEAQQDLSCTQDDCTFPDCEC